MTFRCVCGLFLGYLIYRLRASDVPSDVAMRRYANMLEIATIGLAVFFVSAASRSSLSLARRRDLASDRGELNKLSIGCHRIYP